MRTTSLTVTIPTGTITGLYDVLGTLADGGQTMTNTQSQAVIVCVGAAITGQPSNATVCPGSSASFTVTATAEGTPPPSVQWQVSANGGRTWANLAGKTSATLTFAPTPAQHGYQYRAVFKTGCATAITSAATLTASRIATTSTVSVTPETQQYSDKVNLEVTVRKR